MVLRSFSYNFNEIVSAFKALSAEALTPTMRHFSGLDREENFIIILSIE